MQLFYGGTGELIRHFGAENGTRGMYIISPQLPETWYQKWQKSNRNDSAIGIIFLLISINLIRFIFGFVALQYYM